MSCSRLALPVTLVAALTTGGAGCRAIAGYDPAANASPRDAALDARRDGRSDGAPRDQGPEIAAPDLPPPSDVWSPDALSPDASPPDGLPRDLLASDAKAVAALGCAFTQDMIEVPGLLLADTVIADNSLPLGGAPTGSVGGPERGVALLRFGVQPPPGATGAPLRLQLTLYPAQVSAECGVGCTPCAPVEAAGVLALAYVTPAWDEAQATWKDKAMGLAWKAPGALGGDSSNPLAAAVYQPGLPVVFDSARYIVWPSYSGNWTGAGHELAFRVAAAPGVRMVLRFKEVLGACPTAQTLTAELVAWFCVPK